MSKSKIKKIIFQRKNFITSIFYNLKTFQKFTMSG